MSDEQRKPEILVTDAKILHKIKFMQIKRQLVPMLIIFLLILVSVFWKQGFNKTIMLALSLAAFAWYLFERALFRTREKIAAPQANAFVSPLSGRVKSIRQSSDATLVTLTKSLIDVVEVRLPYPDLQKENESHWLFQTRKGNINVRIQAGKITYLGDTLIHGSVIGTIRSGATLTIQVPSTIEVLVKEHQNVFGGETSLFIVEPVPKAEEEPGSILAEEPPEESDISPDE